MSDSINKSHRQRVPTPHELASLAALLTTESSGGNDVKKLRAALDLMLSASELTSELTDALEKGQSPRTWLSNEDSTRDEDEQRRLLFESVRGKKLDVGRSDKDSEILFWIRENAKPKKDNGLTYDGLITAILEWLVEEHSACMNKTLEFINSPTPQDKKGKAGHIEKVAELKKWLKKNQTPPELPEALFVYDLKRFLKWRVQTRSIQRKGQGKRKVVPSEIEKNLMPMRADTKPKAVQKLSNLKISKPTKLKVRSSKADKSRS